MMILNSNLFSETQYLCSLIRNQESLRIKRSGVLEEEIDVCDPQEGGKNKLFPPYIP